MPGPVFDLSSPRLVLAGTLYGETRGWGYPAMENVAQVILNRTAARWGRATGVVGVCLAPRQFSCWNVDDPNRAKILAAPSTPAVAGMWNLCLGVADAALGGKNPDRVKGADSYFARSMSRPPYWAVPPAVQTYSDNAHAFWLTRASPHAPNVASAPRLAAQQDDADALDDRFNPGG